MRRKTVSGIMLSLLLIGMLILTFTIQPVKSEPTTWTVDDDGPADFSSIQEAVNAASDGDTILVRAGTYYDEVLIKGKSISLIGEDPSTTLIDRMVGGIPIEVRIAERVNITGFTVMNSGEQWRSNMFFEEWPESGILLWNSDECNVHGNIVKYNYYGVTIYSSWSESKYNTVSDNLIANNSAAGIFLEGHVETGLVYSETTIIENTITNNWAGLSSYLHSDNRICHNSFINNTLQTLLTTGDTHIWDDGYPSGGNYWSDYEERYPDAEEIDGSGIWGTPYVIDENNTDYYPLMYPWGTSPPVGGIYIPVNKLELLAPYIGLTILLTVAVLTVVYIGKRKRHTEINSLTNNQRTDRMRAP
jgi:parallel beta-helix repeat protein